MTKSATSQTEKRHVEGDFPRSSVPSGQKARSLLWLGKDFARILPKALFLDDVRREHMRRFRSGRSFSLVVISIDAPTDAVTDALWELARKVEKSARETDTLGWYSDHSIAVLLADTDVHGGEDFITRIEAQEFHYPLSFQILTHPELQPFSAQASAQRSSLTPPPVASDVRKASATQLAIKRIMDIVGAVVGIIIFSPIMLLTGIAVKATSSGPVLFKQLRVGRHGKPFTFLKFRSMWINADQALHRAHVESLIAAGPPAEEDSKEKTWNKMDADPRITPVGRFIRNTSIDELPQFFNVLKGDMSLVGPRPAIPYEVECYDAWHLRRILEAKPGITGLWQAEGRGAITFDDMVRLDLKYAQNWSLLMDIKILAKTVIVVLRRQGAK